MCKGLVWEVGFEVIEIIYGFYMVDLFKSIFCIVSFVVFFVEQELQGIVLQEIWVMNILMFLWNLGIWMYNGCNYVCCFVFYQIVFIGCLFWDVDEFWYLLKFCLDQFEFWKWILENMMDKICVVDFLEKVFGYFIN